MWTYDNPRFLKFCLVCFWIGSILNLYFGFNASKWEYIVNGVLLAILSAGIWQIRRYVTLRLNA